MADLHKTTPCKHNTFSRVNCKVKSRIVDIREMKFDILITLVI